jgi:hypothetical protein
MDVKETPEVAGSRLIVVIWYFSTVLKIETKTSAFTSDYSAN